MKNTFLPKHFLPILIGAVLASPCLAGPVTIQKTSFEGWDNCYRVSNGEVELIAVADVGPRILKFGFTDRPNLLSVSSNSTGQTGGDSWKGYGGHRLWVAPETADVTYYPDNFECDVQIGGGALTLTAPVEVLDADLRASLSFSEIQQKAVDPEFRKQLRFRKQMEIRMDESGEATIWHRVANCGLQTYQMAPWALTVMDKEGIGIVPNPPYAPHGPGHWLPERSIITWSYTNMADPRLLFMKKYISIRQDPSIRAPLKIGFSTTQGWTAYALKDQLFVKKLDYFQDQIYPDMGCSVEVFTSSGMMEVESLGPLTTLKPGDAAAHRERWKLYRIAPIDQNEENIETMLKTAGLE
ncbi:MAG: hypothetical protein JXR73_11330 [Candidatus Omnitrophica bacterium]|nr:hypothetical protein [Candidatus Omnitrophota bacterium]